MTCAYLKRRGYKILERNFMTLFGEADIIAWKRGVVCFVEVKTRTSAEFGGPEGAVNAAKRERYRKIAQLYFSQRGEEADCRFDVAAITDGKLVYYEGAYI